MLSLYLSLKALHLIAMVSWFAGLFYLPRLFVYHAALLEETAPEHLKKEPHSREHARFVVMEGRLLKIIMLPAASLTLITGFAMLSIQPGLLALRWMQLVILSSLALVVFHLYCIYCHQLLNRLQQRHSQRFYRIFNEFPTLILILCMLLFTFRPSL